MVASRTVLVRIRADADQFNREVVTSTGSMRKLGDESDRTGASIDRYSGRLKTLGQFVGALGPGLTPILGATTQATAGLATQIGFTVLAAGSAIIAFQGMGDALKALSEARVAPTAANLAKVEAAMEQLSPAGQDLARTLAGLSDEWQQTKAIAQGGLFPGIENSIDSMMTRLPELQAILAETSTTAGDLLAEGADSLASERWDGLFNYLETSAKPILTDTAHTAGDLTHALSELIVAMDPLTRDFTSGLAAAADDFDKWATGLSETEGFQDFVAYMRTEGPQVAETVGDIASSLVSVLEASSGAGSATLQILQGIANAISAVADSPIGPTLIQLAQVVSIMALLNRGWNTFSTGTVGNFVRGQQQAVAALRATISAEQIAALTTQELAAAQRDLGQKQAAARGTLAKGVAGIAGMGLAALSTQHHIFGLNAASGALMGSMAGPWGAAIGGAVGLMLDFSSANQDAKQNASDFAQTLDQQTGALTKNSAAFIAAKLDGGGYLELAKELGISTGDVTKVILDGKDAVDDYSQSLIDAANASGQITDPTYRDNLSELLGEMSALGGEVSEGKRQFEAIAGAAGDAGDAFGNAAGQVDRFSTSLQDLNTWLDKRAAFRDYKQSIEDANKVLKDNTSTHREVAAALDDVARKAGVVAEGMSKADRQKFLTQALKDLREMKGQGDVADGVIRRLLAQLRELNGTTANAHINVIRHNVGGGSGSGFGPQTPGIATGGLVRGPGTRTSDEIPAWLSDYEYVQRAAAVDHYGVAFMDAVNDLQFPKHAPAVHPLVVGGGGSAGGLDVASIVAALVVTNQRLTELQRAVAVQGPAATGRAVVDRLNQGLASEMRAAEL